MIEYRQRIEQIAYENSPDKGYEVVRLNCIKRSNISNLQDIYSKEDQKQGGEEPGSLEDISWRRVVMLVELENDAMRNRIFLEIVDIKA